MSSSELLTSTSVNQFDPAGVTGRIVAPLSVGFSWSLFGWGGYAACQWFLLAATAKLGTPALVGQFAFATALAGPVFMFTNLQLRGVQSTDARNEYSFPDYLSLRIIGSIFAVVAIIAICLVVGLRKPAMCIVLLVTGFKAFESLADVIAGLMQKYEMLDRAAISLFLRGSASSVVFAVAFAMWRNLPLALMLWAGTAAVTITSYDFQIARRLSLLEDDFDLAVSKRRLQSLAMTSLPLGLVSAFTSLNANLPRYTIEHALSVSDLGIFASIAYPVTAATIISNSLGQSALARLSRHFAQGKMDDFKRVIIKLTACGVALTICGMAGVLIAGDHFLSLLYTPEYARQGHLFLVLALAAGLNCIASFLVYGLTAARSFKVQIPISTAALVTTLVASTVLVPRLKLMGAAMALVISACVQIGACGVMLSYTIAKQARSCGE